jgi:hypothetical protein
MKVAAFIFLIILVFFWTIRRQYRSKRLPPNAQLICDLWNSVADSKGKRNKVSIFR